MAWYDTGTVSVTNGSTTVTGSGTNFIAGAQIGEAFYGPDDNLHEIQAIVSATEITLADVYLGSTQTGQAYKIVPTQSLVADLTTQVSSLISDFQSVKDEAGEGKFDDGTAASAGITFNLDQDTGFFRPAANQIGFSTAGVRRLLLSNSAFQVDVPLTGSAVQSDFGDETAGRVMLNGAGGINGSCIAYTGDIDSFVLPSGNYFAEAATTGVKPLSFNFGFLTVKRRGATGQRSMQIWTVDSNRSFWRVSLNQVWSEWREIISTDRIVGNVTQFGGVPTGALMEYGNTANGEYWRYAGGMQICTHKISLNYSNINTLSTSWTYPAPFSAQPSFSTVLDRSSYNGNATPSLRDAGIISVGSATLTSAAVSLVRVAGSTVNFEAGDFTDVWLTSVGKWF